MQALKKYFENIINTKMTNALRTVFAGSVQTAVAAFRCNVLVSASIRLYQ